MPEFKTGSVQANNLRFHYLEIGQGPLALCLHGFPDSPWTYRFLLPAGQHERVDHSKQFVRDGKDGEKVHTNTLEGFFSVFKRGMVGTYHMIMSIGG